MKKLFVLLFLLSTIGSAVQAENLIDSKDIRNEIDKTVKTEMDNQNAKFGKTVTADTDGGLIKVIKFNMSIVGEAKSLEDKPLGDNKNISNECIAIVIDDAWAIASKKCRLSKGDKINRTAYKVKTADIYSFMVLSNPSANIWNKVKSYELNNFFLLNAVNENSYPLFATDAKANLAFTNTTNMDKLKSDFSGGIFEVNRTERKIAAEFNESYEDNFHPYYGADREKYSAKVRSINKGKNNIIAKVKAGWNGKELRAGDPLFYILNGKKYLLGFGNAVNLWDNFDNTRSQEVILLTGSDKQEIINNIKSVDPEAASRIEKRTLVK